MASGMQRACGLIVVCVLQAAEPSIAQQAGTQRKEEPPAVTIKHCTRAAGCEEEETALTLDANWRWVHSIDGAVDCYTNGAWQADLCPNPEDCAKNCALDGVDAYSYEHTYGVANVPGGISLKYVTKGEYGVNVGSRLYMLDGKGEDTYKMFRLKNRELTFTVEGSRLACGLNGALYLVEMKEDGGLHSLNHAGAKYGTGYCNAQCPHDVKFMGGKANVLGWDATAELGRHGHCCTELDIWEANMADTAFTPHTCDGSGPFICTGMECGDIKTDERYKGVCDKDGCDFNTFRNGNESFYGPGPKFTVDTSKPITVVTQFLTDDGTDDGELVEMRRFYVQDGKVIPNAESAMKGVPGNAVSDAYCTAQKELFETPNDFGRKGGMKAIGEVMDRGMVLVLSLWDDNETDMLWLDASAPTQSDKPGAKRGPCADSSGRPQDLRSRHPEASVSYYDIKYGELGSTVDGLPEAKATSPAPPTTEAPSTTTKAEAPTTAAEAQTTAKAQTTAEAQTAAVAPTTGTEAPTTTEAAPAPAAAPAEAKTTAAAEAAAATTTAAAAGEAPSSSSSGSSSSSSSSSAGEETKPTATVQLTTLPATTVPGTTTAAQALPKAAPAEDLQTSTNLGDTKGSFCCVAGTLTGDDVCDGCPQLAIVRADIWCGQSSFNCQDCSSLAVWCEVTDDSAPGSPSNGTEDAPPASPPILRKDAAVAPVFIGQTRVPTAAALLAVLLGFSTSAAAVAWRFRGTSPRAIGATHQLYTHLTAERQQDSCCDTAEASQEDVA